MCPGVVKSYNTRNVLKKVKECLKDEMCSA